MLKKIVKNSAVFFFSDVVVRLLLCFANLFGSSPSGRGSVVFGEQVDGAQSCT